MDRLLIRHQPTNNETYYLYRHIRLDKNEPFYIGIGSKPENKEFKLFKTEYGRAFSKQRKDSKIWKDIVKKTEYTVEILIECENYDDIKQKEIEFIALYGRIDKKTGCLANMTDGGDGTLGIVVSEEKRKKLRETSHFRGRHGKDHLSSKKVYQYDLNGEFLKDWENITEAAKYIKVHKSTLQKIVKHSINNNYCKGFYWSDLRVDKIEKRKFRVATFAKIEMIEPLNDEVIKTFDSKEEALRYLGKRKSGTHITKSIRRNGLAYGYKWKEVLI